MTNGNYTPLNLNCVASFINNQGLTINPTALAYMGSSTNAQSYTYGAIVTDTVLNDLVSSIALAFDKIGDTITAETYDRLITIGSTTIPCLGNTKPATYPYYFGDITAKFGWLRLISYVAYQEFHINSGSYMDFLHSFNACESYKRVNNKLISSFAAAKTFMDGSFSNMNDLISSDITGVNLATLYFGQDLINTGRAINLAEIDRFGTPSVLLKTIQVNKGLSKSLSLAMLSTGLTPGDIDRILTTGVTTITQEKNIYDAFTLIVGVDLKDICIPLNCQTPGLRSLADLLNPKYLFPQSYTTLTVPRYNSEPNPTNSKASFLIFKNHEPNVLSELGYGTKLRGIMPDPIAYVADAFGTSMMQIKNIKTVKIEKFAQVVTNLENVLTLPTGSTSKPTNDSAINAGLITVASGSGKDGLFTTCDFFGAMSGLSYDWQKLYTLIKNIESSNLKSIYKDMFTLLSGTGPYDELDTLIDSANNEIASILASKPDLAKSLNDLYDSFGLSLFHEMRARSLALPDISSLSSGPIDVYTFIETINLYANETQDFGPSRVLEAISQQGTIGGNSLIASLREARNTSRLGLAGLQPDNGVTKEVIPKPRTGVSPGYTNNGLAPTVPIITGAAIPGSLAGSPETTLIPDNLSVLNVPSTVLTPAAALEEVIRCNCDCWD